MDADDSSAIRALTVELRNTNRRIDEMRDLHKETKQAVEGTISSVNVELRRLNDPETGYMPRPQAKEIERNAVAAVEANNRRIDALTKWAIGGVFVFLLQFILLLAGWVFILARPGTSTH